MTKKRYAFFLLPFPKFCLFLGKIFLFFLAFVYVSYWGCEFFAKKMYTRTTDYLLRQRKQILNNDRKKELQNEESELSSCINSMKHEIFFGGNIRKNFRHCLLVTNMIEQSYTVSDKMKQAAIQSHQLYTYKIRGTVDAIDRLFTTVLIAQSSFFCKNIVLTKQSDDMYNVNLVFKEYGEQKK